MCSILCGGGTWYYYIDRGITKTDIPHTESTPRERTNGSRVVNKEYKSLGKKEKENSYIKYKT